jgi:hypothetical protein
MARKQPATRIMMWRRREKETAQGGAKMTLFGAKTGICA